MACLAEGIAPKKGFRIEPCIKKTNINFRNAFIQWEAYSKKEVGEEYRRTFRVMKKAKYFVDTPEEHTISSGEERVKNFEDTLKNGFNMMLNRFQKEFSNVCMQALLPLIMGEDEWRKYGPNLLKKRKWKVPKKMVACLSNRRMGKTLVMVRIIVTLAKIMPGYRVAVASNAQRISDEAKKKLVELAEELELNIPRNTQEVVIISEDPMDKTVTSEINFYPSNPEKLRGIPADLIFLDEAGFAPPAMFYDVILPIWGVAKTVAILVTTPPKKENPFTDILYATHPETGDKLVMDYILDMVCQRCKKKSGKIKSCKHQIRKYLPDHKSAEKLDIAAILYKDQDSFNREFLGTSTTGTDSTIEENYITDFMVRKIPFKLERRMQLVKHIIISCDPNVKFTKNDKGSDMALVAISPIGGYFAVSELEHHMSDRFKSLLDRRCMESLLIDVFLFLCFLFFSSPSVIWRALDAAFFLFSTSLVNSLLQFDILSGNPQEEK